MADDVNYTFAHPATVYFVIPGGLDHVIGGRPIKVLHVTIQIMMCIPFKGLYLHQRLQGLSRNFFVCCPMS